MIVEVLEEARNGLLALEEGQSCFCSATRRSKKAREGGLVAWNGLMLACLWHESLPGRDRDRRRRGRDNGA
jgi:hypothetical protein